MELTFKLSKKELIAKLQGSVAKGIQVKPDIDAKVEDKEGNLIEFNTVVFKVEVDECK